MRVEECGHYRIYADDGAPSGWGVLAILVNDPNVGWAVVSHSDYYLVMRDGAVFGMDFAGALDAVVNNMPNVTRFMVGRMVSKAEFDAVFTHALAQADLAKKCGFLPSEHRPGEGVMDG